MPIAVPALMLDTIRPSSATVSGVCLQTGRDAQNSAGSAAHAPDPPEDGVSDARAGPIESPDSEPALGPFGEERGQCLGCCRQGVEASPPAPALPLTPGTGVHVVSGGGEFRLDRGGDALGVGQYDPRRWIEDGRDEKLGSSWPTLAAAPGRANGGCDHEAGPPQRRVKGRAIKSSFDPQHSRRFAQ